MPSLQEVNNRHASADFNVGSDKGTIHSYLEFYEKEFCRFVGKKVVVLELGVASGHSLLIWKEYFGDDAIVHGVDISPEPDLIKGVSGVVFHRGNCTDKRFLDKELEGIKFDIIIDDASHEPEPTIESFKILYPALKYGGVYVVEDVYKEARLVDFEIDVNTKRELVDLRKNKGRSDDFLVVFRKSVDRRSAMRKRMKVTVGMELHMDYLRKASADRKCILEIGCQFGTGSTAAFWDGFDGQEQNEKHWISIDIVDSLYPECRPTLPFWKLVVGDSTNRETLKTVVGILPQGTKADLIFIDTTHTYEHMEKELELWKDIASSDCVWLFHDTWLYGSYNHMTDAIKDFAKSTGRWTYKDVTTESHGLGMLVACGEGQ